MQTEFNNYKPTPTEFLGMRMKSKSEAIFAACLHFAGWEIIYEPHSEDHAWDFVARKPFSAWHRPVYIEYKPSQPTMTYVDNLIEKVRPYADRCSSFFNHFDCFVVWGSPFCKDYSFNVIEDSPYVCYPIFTRLGKHGWGEYDPGCHGLDAPFSYYHVQTEILGIGQKEVHLAMSHRFDLQH